MKSYWDLSERERAALITEQVESFVGVELMNAGVLAPTPLELLPVPVAPVPDANLFTISGLSHYDVYFRSEQEARAVVEMIVNVQRKRLTPDDWSGPSALVVLGDDPRERTVQPVAVYTALSSMWDDWHKCCAKGARMQRVRDTFLDYVKLCDGVEHTAAKFLAKSFPQPDIDDACEWFGITISDRAPDEAAA